ADCNGSCRMPPRRRRTMSEARTAARRIHAPNAPRSSSHASASGGPTNTSWSTSSASSREPSSRSAAVKTAGACRAYSSASACVDPLRTAAISTASSASRTVARSGVCVGVSDIVTSASIPLNAGGGRDLSLLARALPGAGAPTGSALGGWKMGTEGGAAESRPTGGSRRPRRIPPGDQPLVQRLEPLHVRRRKREVEHVRVLPDPLPVDGFRDHDQILLQRPADQHLRRRAADALRDRAQRRVAQLPPLGERAVRLERNAVGPAQLHHVLTATPAPR